MAYFFKVSNAVGAEDESEKTGHQVVELAAVFKIVKFSAVCTGGVSTAHGTGFHFAVAVHGPVTVTALAFTL